MNDIGGDGRCWRLMRDDMMSSKAEIVYNAIHTPQIPLLDGEPQGGVDSGPRFNVYTRPPLENCLEVTKSAASFSDVVVNVAASNEDM